MAKEEDEEFVDHGDDAVRVEDIEFSSGSEDEDDIMEQKAGELYSYIEGEEDYTEKPPTMKRAAKRYYSSIIRHFKIIMGRYRLRRLFHEFDHDASHALLLVCKSQKVTVVEIVTLLEMGADPNCCCKKHNSPLHYLARRGIWKGMWPLLQAGAKINATNHRNETALMVACDSRFHEQAATVRFLLQQPKININVRDAGANTAMLNAVYKSNIWVLRELLLGGGSVSEKPLEQDGSPIDAAQFIYTTGLLLDADQVPDYILDPFAAYPLYHEYVSPRGRFRNSITLFLQTIYTYDEELIFRMCQRKRLDEPKIPYKKPKKLPVKRDVPNSRVEVEQRNKERRDRKIDKKLRRMHDREYNELENWNKVRRNNAAKVDKDFDHGIRSDKPTHEWVREEFVETAAKTNAKVPVGEWSKQPIKQKGHYTQVPLPAPSSPVKAISMKELVSSEIDRKERFRLAVEQDKKKKTKQIKRDPEKPPLIHSASEGVGGHRHKPHGDGPPVPIDPLNDEEYERRQEIIKKTQYNGIYSHKDWFEENKENSQTAGEAPKKGKAPPGEWKHAARTNIGFINTKSTWANAKAENSGVVLDDILDDDDVDMI